jgi:uncharacterized cysteine cluster protein YcgN (CxxCxxCC family)
MAAASVRSCNFPLANRTIKEEEEEEEEERCDGACSSCGASSRRKKQQTTNLYYTKSVKYGNQKHGTKGAEAKKQKKDQGMFLELSS